MSGLVNLMYISKEDIKRKIAQVHLQMDKEEQATMVFEEDLPVNGRDF